MKSTYLFAVLILSGGVNAGPSVTNPGSSLTSGPSSDSRSLFAATYNPALASVTVSPDEKWRINYLPAFTLGLELGDANNFIDEIDDLIDILDDPSSSPDSVEDTLERFNNVLGSLGRDGHLTVSQGITAPLTPVFWRPDFTSGTFFAEISLETQVRVAVLDDELYFDNQSFSTASSAYLKSGLEKRIALGYSRELFNDDRFNDWGGRLYGGVKLNLINLELSKQVMRLELLEGKDIGDVIEDEYETNSITTTAASLDVGFSWIAERYRAGFTIANLNSPTFEYGAVGVNCDRYEEDSFGHNNCGAAHYFSAEKGVIKSHETHTKHAVATVDGSFYPLNNWVLNASMDLAAYDDLVGSANKWLNASTAFYTASKWLPDLRLGYHKNMAGSELSSVSAGISLFGSLNLDAEMGLQEIRADDGTSPRSLAFSVAFEERF